MDKLSSANALCYLLFIDLFSSHIDIECDIIKRSIVNMNWVIKYDIRGNKMEKC